MKKSKIIDEEDINEWKAKFKSHLYEIDRLKQEN